VASSLSHEASLPAESTCTLWESPDGTPGADSQGRLRASSTSSTRVDGRVARPRRRGASCNRRIASSPTRISNTTRSSYPSFDAMDNPQSPHRYVTSPEGPYARTSDHSNHGSDIQSRYVFPPGMNADIVPCSSVPISTGAFESNYMTAYPSLFVFPDAERYSVGSSMSRYSASPNEIPSNLHVHQQVSTNSPVGEPHRDWQRAYDLRTRVDSQSSIAYAIPVGPTQQDTLNSKSSFRAAKHCYSSSQSSCASSTSSSLDSFLSTTAPYAPSECITHNMGLDAGLQVQQYSGDPDFQNLNSVINSEFSPYTLPNDMVVSGDLYHAAHQK
jgi:hypothetical protein